MNGKITELAPIIFEEVQKANNILLHCHPSPDPDSVGSSLSWMHYLKSLGKNVTVIIGDSEPGNNLKVLPGFDQIQMKNYFEINPEEFDLFIINDAADITRVSTKGIISFPKSMKTIVIDHHPSNPGFADINLIEAEYVSAGQIVYELYKLWDVEITPDIASNLLLAIYTDSGGLKYAPTDHKTIQAFSELTAILPDYHKLIFKYENSRERDELKFRGIILSSIEEYFDKKVALAAISEDRLMQNKIQKKNAVGMSNILISVPDWKIGITMIEKEKNTVNVSMRSADPEQYDLSLFTQSIGGGGHKAAAGALIRMPLQEAKKFLLEKLKEMFPDLGKI
jgi:phosphoesterase RecJ-like protein